MEAGKDTEPVRLSRATFAGRRCNGSSQLVRMLRLGLVLFRRTMWTMVPRTVSKMEVMLALVIFLFPICS